MALRLRRGTDAERQTILPLQGELIYVTDTKKLYVGDGATQGGVLVGPIAFDQLSGSLDLNGNNIVGTGNININGTITATGNINLGDAAEDSITVAGLINSDLKPAIDDTYSLGDVSKQWSSIWATQINVDTTLAVGSSITKLNGGNPDSTGLLWDSENDTIFATTFEGNLFGNVYSLDNSTLLVDGANNSIFADNIVADSTNTASLRTNIVFGTNQTNTDGTELYVPTGQGLNIIGFNGSVGDFQPQAPGDVMSSFAFSGLSGNAVGEYRLALGMFAQWDATADLNTNTPRANLLMAFGDNSDEPTPLVFINYTGNVTATSFTTGSYSGSGNYPTNPTAGTIVFDDSDNHFYGFNGTTWVQLDN